MADPQLHFVQLLTSHQARLYGYILSLIGDPDQARDVMQETNTVLWRKSDEFELGTNFAAWMLKTAYYQVMAHRQRMSRERLVFGDELTVELAEAAAEENAAMDERQAMLRECLTKLNDRYHDVIKARYLDGFELSDVASRMDINMNTLKQVLFRARAALIDCVRDKGREAAT